MEYAVPLSIFGAGVVLQFFSDRTGVWLKEQKQFDPWVFAGLCLASLGLGFATLKKSDKDLGFLNRDQTDEWKGWMQSKLSLYYLVVLC